MTEKISMAQVKIDMDLYRALQALRAETGVPVAQSVRRALREYLARHSRIEALVKEYSQSEGQDE